MRQEGASLKSTVAFLLTACQQQINFNGLQHLKISDFPRCLKPLQNTRIKQALWFPFN